MDIALAVDASGSVGVHSYQVAKSFLKLFTHHFEVNNTVHFACLHYDHRVYKDFEFKDIQFRDHDNLDAKIQNMTYPSGATLTQYALTACQHFFNMSNGARNKTEARRVLVIFTDGPTWGGKERLKPPVHELKVHWQKKGPSTLFFYIKKNV